MVSTVRLSDSPHDSASKYRARASSGRIITHKLRAHPSRYPSAEMGRYLCHEGLRYVHIILKACGSVHSTDLLLVV